VAGKSEPTGPKGRSATGSGPVGSERRQEVLEQAAMCFAETGYRGTSMRQIAEAAGMLAGSLYSHFDSKIQMLEELMSSFFCELLPSQESAAALEGSIADRFAAMITSVVDVCERHRDVVMVIELDWHEIVNIPELKGVVKQGQESSLLIRRLLEEGVATGEIREDIDLDCIVRLVHTAIHGLLDRRFRLTTSQGGIVDHFSAGQVSSTLNALFSAGLFPQRTRGGRVGRAPAASVRSAKDVGTHKR
jgi:TetR/AcrR family transcriptional regulator, cholesterol catabolism regulator